MPTVNFKVDLPEKFSSKEKEIFCEMLLKQGKVKNPSIDKLNNCKILCVCLVNGDTISIGAIKPKSPSDFSKTKANLLDLSSAFTWELGYCYTDISHVGKGYSSAIVKKLIENFGHENLMASTELRINNSMVRILERFGFKQYGNVWKSTIHQGILGLFLRLVK